jgi:hypothetical protein
MLWDHENILSKYFFHHESHNIILKKIKSGRFKKVFGENQQKRN